MKAERALQHTQEELGVRAKKDELMAQRTCLSRSHVLSFRSRPEHAQNDKGLRALRHQTTVRVLTFTAIVFVLDLLTPLGIPYWLLYSVPFFFLRYNTPRHLPYLLAIVCTILILLGSVFSPLGSAESLTHRASGAVILWVVAIILVRRRP